MAGCSMHELSAAYESQPAVAVELHGPMEDDTVGFLDPGQVPARA